MARSRFERLGVDPQQPPGLSQDQPSGSSREQQSEGNTLSYFKKLLQEQQSTIEELLQEQKKELSEKVDPDLTIKFWRNSTKSIRTL